METPTTNNMLVWGLFKLASLTAWVTRGHSCDKCFQYVLEYSMHWGWFPGFFQFSVFGFRSQQYIKAKKTWEYLSCEFVAIIADKMTENATLACGGPNYAAINLTYI